MFMTAFEGCLHAQETSAIQLIANEFDQPAPHGVQDWGQWLLAPQSTAARALVMAWILEACGLSAASQPKLQMITTTNPLAQPPLLMVTQCTDWGEAAIAALCLPLSLPLYLPLRRQQPMMAASAMAGGTHQPEEVLASLLSVQGCVGRPAGVALQLQGFPQPGHEGYPWPPLRPWLKVYLQGRLIMPICAAQQTS